MDNEKLKAFAAEAILQGQAVRPKALTREQVQRVHEFIMATREDGEFVRILPISGGGVG